MSRLTALWNRLTGRTTPLTPTDPTVPWIGHPATPTGDTDPAYHPATGYPHDYFANHHTETTGEPNRGDELTWVTTQIAAAAAAGILDENNHHYLRDQINARAKQWHHAIDTTEARRIYTTEGLIAAATGYLTTAREQLTQTTTDLNQAEHEHTHHTTHLTGHTHTPTHHKNKTPKTNKTNNKKTRRNKTKNKHTKKTNAA